MDRNRTDLTEDNEEALASATLWAVRFMLVAAAQAICLALLAYMLWIR